jgi:hypothetical protein
MMRRIISLAIVPLIFSLLFLSLSYADTAEVLPKGVTGVRLEYQHYFPIDEQYNDDGDTEDVATDYNANLNSGVFPALSLIEQAFGMLPGSASVGNSVVSMEYQFDILDFYIQHGITDRLSIGAKIPYWIVKNDVSAGVNTANATVGINPNYGQPGDPFGVPIIPVSFGGIKNDALATEFVQNILVEDYGYDRIESWSGSGFSDIELGARYQYLNTEQWRLAFTGSVLLPTGEEDDPDNLMDYPLGGGAYGLIFYLNNDYTGLENFVFNATLEYDLIFSDNVVMRVPDDVNQPITANKEEVDRNTGDLIQLNLSGTYQFLKGSSVLLEYEYYHKSKDSISGNQGFAYDQLEAESDQTSHVFKVGLSYSTIPLYQEKKFSLPLNVSLLYRNRFAGENAFKSQYIQLGIAVFF